MIILAIKSYLFFDIDNYSFKQKSHMSHFFIFFCGEIIRVVYAMLILAIKDLKVRLGNSNLLFRKSAIWFKFWT